MCLSFVDDLQINWIEFYGELKSLFQIAFIYNFNSDCWCFIICQSGHHQMSELLALASFSIGLSSWWLLYYARRTGSREVTNGQTSARYSKLIKFHTVSCLFTKTRPKVSQKKKKNPYQTKKKVFIWIVKPPLLNGSLFSLCTQIDIEWFTVNSLSFCHLYGILKCYVFPQSQKYWWKFKFLNSFFSFLLLNHKHIWAHTRTHRLSLSDRFQNSI